MEPILHFYPGHSTPVRTNIGVHKASIGPGLLIALKGDVVIFRGEAWGGPSQPIPMPGEPTLTPTPRGTFVLRAPEPHTTKKWRFSRIKWGTKLKVNPANREVLYEQSRTARGESVWASLMKDFKISRTDVEDIHEALFGYKRVPETWVFNDFGPIAVRFFRDLNKNRKLDKGESLEGAMLHTTPQNEIENTLPSGVQLEVSHGCIHMKPKDRDALIGMGVLRAGNTIVIHSYTEKYGARR